EKTITQMTYSELTDNAQDSGKIADERIEKLISNLESASRIKRIYEEEVSWEEKSGALKDEKSALELLDLAIVDLDGNLTFADGKTSNVSDREYFSLAKGGESTTSDPVLNKTKGVMQVAIAVPIK